MTSKTSRMTRNRVVYLIAAIAIMALGLSIRRFKETLPAVVTAVFPDALWTVMIFSLLALISPRAASRTLVLGALLISYGVEVSQLYHAPWIDTVRSYKLGGWILGFTFLWSDLLWYTLGGITSIGLDRTLRRVRVG